MKNNTSITLLSEPNLVEKVARAICRAGICGPKKHLDEQENLHWRKFELEAEAAIAVMTEENERLRIELKAIEIAPHFKAVSQDWEYVAKRMQQMAKEALGEPNE